MIKTAMILSAGYGRRLLPLTRLRPKPMFQVLNKTMLEWWAEALVSAGVKRAVVNVHHQADRMLEHIRNLAESFSGLLEIIPSPEEGLLGTGGGLKRAETLLGKNDFLVVNADIFPDFDLVKLALKHLANPGRLATLGLLAGREPARVSLGQYGRVVAFRAPGPVPEEIGRQLYSGVMALSPAIFDLIKEGESDIIEVFSRLMPEGREIFGWTYDPAIWRDMGEIEDYWRLNRDLASGRTIIHSTAKIDGLLTGWNVVGAEAVVEKEAAAENCVLWPGASLARGATALNAVIAGPVPAGARVSGGVFCVQPEE
ncbi:MAG: NTP transferase domain-containing protein [Candidatus Adiutrix sp.]|jgi:mannose-1-phosphate guanylyltransferase|nr:NTP transferase domain-containing protein [Candidatus Adiutrix sp.]